MCPFFNIRFPASSSLILIYQCKVMCFFLTKRFLKKKSIFFLIFSACVCTNSHTKAQGWQTIKTNSLEASPLDLKNCLY